MNIKKKYTTIKRIPAILISAILFFLAGCKEKPPHTDIIFKIYKSAGDTLKENIDAVSKLEYYKGDYYAFIGYNSTKQLNEIHGYLLNKTYGHSFKFDSLNDLKTYEYLCDDTTFTYGLHFNNRWDETGNPFVDFWDDESTGIAVPGTKNHILWFSEFPRHKLFISISTDGKAYRNYKTEKSTLMPLLESGTLNINSANPGGLIYFKIVADSLILPLKGISDKKTFYDTLVVSTGEISRK